MSSPSRLHTVSPRVATAPKLAYVPAPVSVVGIGPLARHV